MPISKDKKKEIFDNLTSIAKDAKSVVFVNFHGVNVGDTTSMRKALTAAGVKYVVAKKSLIKKVLGEKDIQGTLPELSGEVALAYAEDMIAPAREVYEFQKKLENKISILGGIFEGMYKNKEEMMSIATIPSLHVLHGQFVNLINSPIQGLVIALKAIADGKTE